VLLNEDSSSDVRMYASQALCNMTCEELIEKKNNILNRESFIKLKSLMEKVISSSEESVSNEDTAQKNAVVIENIFLMLSNILVGNVNALTPIMNSGFKFYILNYLIGYDDDDDKRQTAGNISNQQLAALRILHSITSHQSEHISSLISCNLLSCVKMSVDSDNQSIVEIAMCGVLYNIAVKGNMKHQECEGEVNTNEYLSEYEQVDELMDAISNAAKTGSIHSKPSSYEDTTRIKQYATLILGQLYRNKKLKEEYQHIIQSLKTLKSGSNRDLSFKAQNTLEMLSKNDGMCICMNIYVCVCIC
jgi:hypothetical protein